MTFDQLSNSINMLVVFQGYIPFYAYFFPGLVIILNSIIAFRLLTDFYTLRKDVETTSKRVDDIRASAGIQKLEEESANLERKAAESSFWDDRAKAQETLLALTDIKEKIKLLMEFKMQVLSFLLLKSKQLLLARNIL